MADKPFPVKEADGTTIDNADTSPVTVNGVPSIRARIVTADPTDAAGLAKVENTRPGATDYGVVTRPMTATDGTHDTPTMDSPARPGFVTVTDLGTHADAAITDPASVTTATTAMALWKGFLSVLGSLLTLFTDTHDATNHALSVTIVADNSANIANPLPVQVGDGTHVMPTGDAAARAIFTKAAQGVKATPVAVSVATTATQLIAANAGRRSLLIVNNSSATIFLGNSGVTTANGIPLAVGAALSDVTTTDAWYAVVASGTADVRVVEIA